MLLGDVIAHIVEFERHGSVPAFAGDELFLQRQIQLPRAAAHGLKLAHVIIKKAALIGGGLGSRLAQKQRADVVPVNGIGWKRGRAKRGKGRQQIEHGGQLPAFRAGGDFARPARDAGHAHRPLARVVAPAFVRQVAALRWIAPGRAVVGGPDDERFFIQPEALQGGEDFAHGPVQLLHTVPPFAIGGLAAEGRAGVRMGGAARHGVRQVKEERLVLVRLNVADGLLRVALREVVAIHGRFDDIFIAHERQLGPNVGHFVLRHVIAVRNAEVGVETLARGQELRLVPQMPFADDGGGVARAFHHLGHGGLLRMQALRGHGLKHEGALVADMQVQPARVAARHGGGAAGSADAAGGIKTGQPHALGGHLVQMRRAVLRQPVEAGHIAIAEIVAEDKDEARVFACPPRTRWRRRVAEGREVGRAWGKGTPRMSGFFHHAHPR